MIRYIRILLPSFCLLLCGVIRPSASDAEGMDITLQKIMEAPRIVDYEGILTIQKFTDEAEPIRNTHRIIHQKPDRNRIDRFDPATKDKFVVVQIDRDVYQRQEQGDSTYYTHRQLRGESSLDFGLGFSSLNLLDTNYDLVIEGNDTILDRTTVKLSLQPRHPRRISKTAWIDEATGLVLRTEDRDEYGNLIEEMYFSRIIVNPMIDESLFATDEWADRAVEENQVIACGTMKEVEKEAGFALAAPVYMPAGFTLDRLRVILYANQPTAHFTYTDGLAQISLYQRVAPPTDKTAMAWPTGTPEVQNDVQVWNRGPLDYILRHNDDTRLFTLVSEISEEESIDMIKSVCVINPPGTAGHSASIDLLWFAGGGVMVGSLILGGWFFRRPKKII